MKLDDGSLRIAAPAELTEPLVALFDQLGRGLRSGELTKPAVGPAP